jgi:hypothetical protein
MHFFDRIDCALYQALHIAACLLAGVICHSRNPALPHGATQVAFDFGLLRHYLGRGTIVLLC